MTLAVTSLTSGSTSPGTMTGFTTASISPASGSLLVLALGGYDGTSTQDFTVSTVTGLSLTWTKQKVTGAGSGDKGDVEVWTALAGASPGSGTITVAFSASSGTASAVWGVDQVTGQNAATPLVGTNTLAATPTSSAAVALAFNAAGSASNLFYLMSLVLLGASQTVTQTPNETPTAWTAVDNLASSSATNNNVALLTSVSPDATNVNAAVSLNASHSWGAIGIELNAATGGTTHNGAAALSGSGTLGAAGQKTVPGAAALSGSGTLTSAGQKKAPGAAALSGSGTLAAAGQKTVPGAAPLTGSGALGAAGSVLIPGAAALSGSGTLTAAGRKTVPGSAALSGVGALTATGSGGTVVTPQQGTVTIANALSASAAIANTLAGSVTIVNTI